MLDESFDVVVIGGSAGALEALTTILSALPDDFPVPIVVVLHQLPTSPGHLVDVFSTSCTLAVKEAEDKEPFASSTVYVAPPDYHVLLERDGRLSLSADDPVHYSRPAIDVLFESAADAFGPRVLAVLLSGANDDGAEGGAYIKAAGGRFLVQSPESASVRAMPDAAIRLGVVDHVATPEAIASRLVGLAEPAAPVA